MLTKATSLADFTTFLHETYAIECNGFTVEQAARAAKSGGSACLYIYRPTYPTSW